MRVIDARSGLDVKPGETVRYPDGEWWKLVRVVDYLVGATAVIHSHRGGVERVPLRVRFTHPAFLFQRVGFFPS